MSGIELASGRSVRPYRSSEEYLYAMKEDLAEWLRGLYGVDVTVDTLAQMLESGALLCAHANYVTRAAAAFLRAHGRAPTPLPAAGVTYDREAPRASFRARDNVSNFISWCRNQMKIKDVLMFETDDLVLRKNEKNVVLCLLEVARRASRFGMTAPILIQLEEEIEEEIRVETNPQEAARPPPQECLLNSPELDQMVQYLISRCTCPTQFPMVKISEGKYRVGDSSTLIFVRILRNHVMVRVGGGWDTLEHYLDKHDPCRCTSLTHKLAHRPATPVHEIKARPCDPDGQPGAHASLLLSRVQSPMEPVLWSPSAPSRGQKAGPSPRLSRSPGPGSRNTPSPNKLKERVLPQPCRQTYSESKDDSTLNSTSRMGREATRTTPSPRQTNSLPRPVRPSSPSQPEILRPSTPLVLQKTYSQASLPDNRMNQTWTKSQFVYKLRQNATGGAKNIQETQNSSGKSSASVSARSLTPVQSLNTKQKRLGSHQPPTISIQVSQDSESARKGSDVIRTFSPSKGLMSVISGTTKDRSPVPTAKGCSPLTTPSVDGNERILQRSSPLVERKLYLDLPKPTLPNSVINKSHSNYNVTTSQEASDVDTRNGEGEEDSNILFTPPPISPAQEALLYQSLEEEILSNIQQLGMESDDSDSDIDQYGRLPGTPQNFPESHKPFVANMSSPYSSSMRNESKDANFKAVNGELSNGRRPLEKVTVENWVNTLSRDFTGHNSTSTSHLKVFEPFMVTSWSSPGSSMDSKDFSEPLPASGTNRTVGKSLSLTTSETNIQEEHWAYSFGQKRSLKKPERVPSIYKLKLRPCIRPRRDHRPDKKPSKIPKPVSLRNQSAGGPTETSKQPVNSRVMSVPQKGSSAPIESWV